MYIVSIVLVLIGAGVYVLYRQMIRHTPGNTSASVVLASYTPPFTHGLITNEYAYFNPTDQSAVRSPLWEMTSGSLFANGDTFWTGVPDSCSNGPNNDSTNCTDSNTFRLDTTQRFAGNIRLIISIRQLQDIHNAACDSNDTCWHGTHLWLRYQNQYNLYYASVNRADGKVVIKRKVPCGPSDSGAYFVLGSYVPHDFKTGMWNTYAVAIQTNPDSSVTIKLYDTNASTSTPIVTGTDRGGTNPHWSTHCTVNGRYPTAAYQPITAPGSVGVRGDYANFEFKHFQVMSL